MLPDTTKFKIGEVIEKSDYKEMLSDSYNETDKLKDILKTIRKCYKQQQYCTV